MHYGSTTLSANPNPVLVKVRPMLDGRTKSALAGYANALADSVRASDEFTEAEKLHGVKVLRRLAQFAKFMVRDAALDSDLFSDGFADPEPEKRVTVDDLSGIIGAEFGTPFGDAFILRSIESVDTLWYYSEDGDFAHLTIGGVFEQPEEEELVHEQFMLLLPVDADSIADYSDLSDGVIGFTFANFDPASLKPAIERIGTLPADFES